MDGSEDYPEHHPPEQEVIYPDIDETILYPWQGNQPATQPESSTTSVLDPRLYKDLFASSASHLTDQPVLDGDYDDEEGDADDVSFASGERRYHQFMDGDDSDDPSYDMSQEESSLLVDSMPPLPQDELTYSQKGRRGIR